MKKFINLLPIGIFGLMIGYLSCQSTVPSRSIDPTELWINNQYDFESIGRAIGDRRIIAIGESSHGIGDYYTFKSELVQYLHREHGYEVLAFEAGLGDLNLAWADIDSLNGQQLLHQTLFGNFRCEELNGLFDYIKESSNLNRPLIYSGIDNQISSDYFTEFIQPIIADYDQAMADSLETNLYAFIRWFRAGHNEDEKKYNKEAKIFTNTGKAIKQVFRINKSSIKEKYNLSENQFKFIDKAADGFMRTVELPFENKNRVSSHRDAIMYDNLHWLMSEIYPNKKVILWAHNGHVEQQSMYENSFKWLGHFLNENYSDDYYAIGLFAQEGSYYRQWGDTTIAFSHTDTSMLEHQSIPDNQTISFNDLSNHSVLPTWSKDTIVAFEPENGGNVYFIPMDRFDGVVTFRTVKAPKY